MIGVSVLKLNWLTKSQAPLIYEEGDDDDNDI
jgi:hypothetical protein